MEIPKTFSGPMNPGLPSMLDLLAELHELIYENLFQRDGDVLLHNRDAEFFHSRIRATPVENGVSILPVRSDESSPQPKDSDLARKTVFVYGVREGVQLLASCHQMYHEASPVLYGRNSFVFSHTLGQNYLYNKYILSKDERRATSSIPSGTLRDALVVKNRQ